MSEPPRLPSDRPGPASGADTLDVLEAQAVRTLLAGDAAGMDAGADADVPLPRIYPIAGPATGRSSVAELRALLHAGRGEPCASIDGARAGYVVEEGPPEQGHAVVRPALAEALAAAMPEGDLRSTFGDLWAVDLEIWNSLGRRPHEIAALWLQSPGRRMVQDLHALRGMPGARRGATDLSAARIRGAAGVEDAPTPGANDAFKSWCATRPAAWRAVHLVAPGQPMLAWAPASGDTAAALHALELSEEGAPASVRGAALSWLITRAREAPQYEVGGITRDLREEFPARLAAALASDERTPARAPAELEEVALAHATRIQAEDVAPGCVFRTWAVAHWLAGCVWRSPFFGGDEPTVVARLRALLAGSSAEPKDALDPAWFHADGLSVADVALVGGALSHPVRMAGVSVAPPSPLVRVLRRIAERPHLRDAERRAEDLLAHGKNELGWTAPHVAPPLAARFWLTERQITWLATAPPETQVQVIDLLARSPERFGWACFAVMEEGAALAPNAKQAAVELWRTWRAASRPKTHERCAFGAGILDGLDDVEAESLVELAVTAEGTWPPYLLDMLASGAQKGGRDAVWSRSVDRLLDLAEDQSNTEAVRLNAALFLAWRLSSKTELPVRALDRLASLVASPPFIRHSGLQRELRRRGVPSKKAAGG